ncbi:hypothetical protein ACIGEZ_02265 [Streptomyces sp. NPDC085481]|uniref:hypothetical protein n=1 Tax=Streptomyces sp. NPDC085481 TaxID=3365727 RepID=UPI0037D1D9A3
MTAQVTFRQADDRDLAILVDVHDAAARWMVLSGIGQRRPGPAGCCWARDTKAAPRSGGAAW